MKATAKRRRGKREIEEEKAAEALRKSEIDVKMAQFDQMQQQLQNLE